MTREEAVRRIHRAAEEKSTELDLSGLDLEELPPQIGKCTQLEMLVLGGHYDQEKREWLGNKLTEFPDVVLQLTNLKILNLSGNHITAIPEAIGQLSNLTKLKLSGNQITFIPEALGQLSNLTRLDLHKNQITSIPEALRQLSNLTQLSLGSNQITSIPEALRQLSNLTQLSLGSNQITSIPEALRQLSNLTQLSLDRNQITSIPEALGQLSNLTQLYLQSNQITSIPEALGQLSDLTQLSLGRNQITSIPEALGQLSNLTQLSLGSNQITSIPEALGQLSNLKRLYLHNNQITSIPEALGQLSNLRQLDLGGNQITSIPEAIRGMEKLEKLNLRGNPMPIPPEILGKSRSYGDPGDLRTILDFYFQTRNPNDTQELNEAKLLIVGEGESGKTTLANKLLNPDYELKEQEPSTEGIDVIRWEFPQANGKPFRVHIWDFGGQEIYHATHQFFLTERSLYILLVDNRRENPNLCYWLNIIELLSNRSPVFLVQNEKQDRRCEINVSPLRRDFENLIEKPLTTNLADNRGLETLQRALQNRITTLDHISTPIPKHWANVRHVLENYAQRKTHIEVSEFYDICATHGFDKSDKQAMLSLSKYLHDLGIILHFQTNTDKKKSILLNWVILRPEWATNAVYKVTDNQQVIANCGYFTDENLSEIWIDRQYQGLHDELLELMENFKICYPIPGQRGHYIAPQRLPLEAPKYDWDDTDNLIVRYKYEFMPKGIITRLIVEMHRLICRPNTPPSSGAARGDIVWRDGVLLADNYAKAEVIENYHQREIRIRVSGTPKNYLLNSIRHKLREIHDTYDKRLKYEELIPCNCSQCKGSQNPYSYAFDDLRDRLANRKYTVECGKPPSYEEVQVRRLIEDFPDYSQEKVPGSDRSDAVDYSRTQQTVNNLHLYFDGNSMNQDYSQTNNLQGANLSGINANQLQDNAQASGHTFNQTNNANTAELLQLISSMRETAAQFPEDEREEVLMEIGNVEEQLNKPQEKRNRKLIAKKLGVILAIAASMATPIANMTDFTNNVTDLAQKAGVELPSR
ncbi:leucine-rich repeat domain-containing protein [Microcoleus vaginatus]|uniref:leucine-rich repeat domain-containing protein n=1 Tax=Microcoleus vaginatus TaxID=119532 RepID=UPI001688B63E|nr:leucine-rich repeat domain-containing protein [Microcoleus sp. FACHB-84]MBD2009278.1 leucine-rich repeat domain-containing protein [Microcoleus sp. FACHB-45]